MLQTHDSNACLYKRCAIRHTLRQRYRARPVVIVYCKILYTYIHMCVCISYIFRTLCAHLFISLLFKYIHKYVHMYVKFLKDIVFFSCLLCDFIFLETTYLSFSSYMYVCSSALDRWVILAHNLIHMKSCWVFLPKSTKAASNNVSSASV